MTLDLVMGLASNESAYEDMVRTEFAYAFGTAIKLIITHIENIPRELSGKTRMIKNHVCPTI